MHVCAFISLVRQHKQEARWLPRPGKAAAAVPSSVTPVQPRLLAPPLPPIPPSCWIPPSSAPHCLKVFLFLHPACTSVMVSQTPAMLAPGHNHACVLQERLPRQPSRARGGWGSRCRASRKQEKARQCPRAVWRAYQAPAAFRNDCRTPSHSPTTRRVLSSPEAQQRALRELRSPSRRGKEGLNLLSLWRR